MLKLGVVLRLIAGADAQDISIPEQLAAAINQVRPNASVVTRSDVDWKSCAPPERDQIIKADLDGDGRLDYAALLFVPKKPGAERKRDGTVAAGWVVVLLGRADGAVESNVLDRHRDKEAQV